MMSIVLEPLLRAIVVFVGRPHEGNEKVHIEKRCGHFWSASRARTFLELTLGDCGAKSKTRKPLIERVGRGVVNARRTRSDTAFPRARERLAAYRFTRRKMSSSRESVVLMVLMMHWMQI